MPTEKYYVYVLLSLKDKKFYIGFTRDLIVRFTKHQNGQVISTKNRKPFVLIHYECFIDKNDAEAREVFLKSGFGREQLRKSLKHTLARYNIYLENAGPAWSGIFLDGEYEGLSRLSDVEGSTRCKEST